MYLNLTTAEVMAELGGEGREFDLNLLHIESETVSLADAVESLNLHQFLRHVQIPRRDSKTDDMPKLFGCLKRRGVRRIHRLDVDEDILFPHSDQVISEAISGLEFDEFNWRKTDMSLALLRDHRFTCKVELYSSGNHAVLPLVESPETVDAYIKEFESSLSQTKDPCALDVRHLSPSAKRECTTWSAVLSTAKENTLNHLEIFSN